MQILKIQKQENLFKIKDLRINVFSCQCLIYLQVERSAIKTGPKWREMQKGEIGG